MSETTTFRDVIIVGAGLSGIGAAYHIQSKCPGSSYAVLEARESMGGTWDLFKYPGLRSDSDMYTLGFPFYPWKNPKAIADGPSILSYIKETAAHFGIDKKIQYNHKVIDAEWSNATNQWTVRIHPHVGVEATEMHCKFLMMCSGYYDYDQGYMPKFPNQAAYQGKLFHPQHWDTTADYANKKVVVIGSGATAVTIVPEMSKTAEKVVMLQRSPTYIMNMPSEDVVSNFLKKVLPSKVAHHLARWKNILFSMFFYNLSKWKPHWVRGMIQKAAEKELGDKYEKKHFDPKYDPWDQRLCLVPDNDLFQTIKEGKVEIVTDTIKQFTPSGIELDSGENLEADIIVAATGLTMRLFGGMEIKVDGENIQMNQQHAYRGVMFSNLPNFAMAVGYTNASWTLKCDLNCQFVAKLINYMNDKAYSSCTPVFDKAEFGEEDLLDLSSGYVQRAKDILPKQGSKKPWKVHQNYIKDLFMLKYGKVDDGHLEFA